MRSSSFLINVVYAFSAQGLSLFLSVLMSLIVPRMLGVEEFSYWQLFLFYCGYVGFLNLGINDGMYLRLGGKEYDKIDHALIGSQFKIVFLFQIIIAMLITLIAIYSIKSEARIFVLISTSIYMVLQNMSGCLGYVFQAVNYTKIYSLSVIIDKILFIIFVSVLLIFKIDWYEIFVIFYLISKALTLLYCIWKGQKIIFSKFCSLIIVFKELWENMSVGLKLMLSNIAQYVNFR